MMKCSNADMRLGATYGMGDYTLFAEYASEGGEGDVDAATSIQLVQLKFGKLQVEHLYSTMQKYFYSQIR